MAALGVALEKPLTVCVIEGEMRQIVVAWARGQIHSRASLATPTPNGTLLLRTAGAWDSLVGFGVHRDGSFSPALLFKNPVPLWRYERALHNGRVSTDRWATLRRTILIHNPGLNGVLALLDEVMAPDCGS